MRISAIPEQDVPTFGIRGITLFQADKSITQNNETVGDVLKKNSLSLWESTLNMSIINFHSKIPLSHYLLVLSGFADKVRLFFDENFFF